MMHSQITLEDRALDDHECARLYEPKHAAAGLNLYSVGTENLSPHLAGNDEVLRPD